MRRLVSGFVFYFLAIIVLSSLLSPLVFPWVEQYWPFKRVFNRTLMVSALVLLWPLVRYLKIRNWRQCGIDFDRSIWREFLPWFGFGVVLVTLLYGLQYGVGLVQWKMELKGFALLGFLLAAVLVGLLEELMFRGVFFLSFAGKNKHAVFWLAVVGSMFFATVHFVKAENPVGMITWWSGVQVWREMGSHLLILKEMLVSWLTLFWLGMLLCVIAWRYGTIWAGAGCHAGLVFALKFFSKVAEVKNSDSIWFSVDIRGGLCATVLLAIAFVWVWQNTVRSRQSNHM